MRSIKALIVILVISALFATGTSAYASEVIVGSEPSVPACQELNDVMDWRTQVYLHDLCDENGIDYCFALAVIEMESHFNPNAYNGSSVDRGLMQINKQWVNRFIRMGWITKAQDLYDSKTNIRCGIYILSECVEKYGNTERAYCYYNTGKESVKSNKASREVMEYWRQWEDRFK